jgi:hypothetical protein
VARHRSPRGRRAHQSPTPAAPGRRVAVPGAHRPVPTPLRRGAAVVAVTGGALSLVGAAAPVATDHPGPAAAAFLPAARTVPAQPEPVLLATAVEPVNPAPPVVGAADLVKAVQLAEQEIARLQAEAEAARQRAAREAAAREQAELAEAARQKAEEAARGALDCGLDTSDLGAVKPHVRDAAEFLGCLYGEPTMHGVAGRAGTSDHPSGKALDFMVGRATGDALAACALRNMDALGITYVIWEQRINTGSGWEPMEDRGGETANHYDHVHISFGSSAGSGDPRSC